MVKEPRMGALAALGGCLAAGIASPLVSFLKMYRTEELLMVRGLMAVLIALIILEFRVLWPGWRLIASALILGGATWSYYQAMRVWGVNLTMMVLTTSPAVNFLIKRFIHNKPIANTAVVALLGVMLGAFWALQPWHGTLSGLGLSWSIASVAFTGIGFDLLGTTEGHPFNRAFWFGLIYAVWGFVLCLVRDHLPFAGESLAGRQGYFLFVFGLAGAAIYLGNIFTFSHLHRETASVLNSAQVVPVMIGAFLIIGESLIWYRYVGVGVAFASATALSYVESHRPDPSEDRSG